MIASMLGPSVMASDEYTLRAGDQLSIVVMQAPEISTPINSSTTQYQVRPDGRLSFPYIGEINAKGLTVTQFSTVLSKGLSKYYVSPKVAINIIKLGSVRIYVFGEVNKPGMHELTKGHTVLDAIGAANGFNWNTGKKKIYLIHQDNTNQVIPIHLNDILTTGNMAENYELREGDILYLTKNHRINFARDIAPLLGAAYQVVKIRDND